MLETRSSAFYPYISLEDAIDYATYYKVESWDEYIIRLAKNIGNNIVYMLNEDLKKVRDVIVLNPFPKELIEQYHEYIKRKTAEKQRYWMQEFIG